MPTTFFVSIIESMTEFEDKMAELKQRFVTRCPACLDELRAALDAGATEAVVSVSHRLAGNAGMFGFPELSEAAAELEDAARQESPAGVAPHGERVLAMLAQIADRGLSCES